MESVLYGTRRFMPLKAGPWLTGRWAWLRVALPLVIGVSSSGVCAFAMVAGALARSASPPFEPFLPWAALASMLCWFVLTRGSWLRLCKPGMMRLLFVIPMLACMAMLAASAYWTFIFLVVPVLMWLIQFA